MTETLTCAGTVGSPTGAPLTLRKELEQRFEACALVRRFRRACYDAGDRLDLSVTGVVPANTGQLVAEVERFVGGGFAGQVYRVRLLALEADAEPLAGLTVGQPYAIKILKPPSGFARFFRDALYFLAYQGPFSAQVNPHAVRVGVLWQKLIRRAAATRLGTEHAVCNTHATFYDPALHSFGEINEWVSGRVWRFEVDDRLFERWDFSGEPSSDINCPEYVHKKLFMRNLVALLHELGAGELARQYEWWTCKSQPNAFKRLDAGPAGSDGLTAIDFRAGLALLPFLPMSPADLALIARGLLRGRLVQFDGSDLPRLRDYIARDQEPFEDLRSAIAELVEQEPRYRGSLPDVTHHGVRLLTDRSLRQSIRHGTITGWRNAGWIDEEHAVRLQQRRGLFAALFTVWLVPLLGNLTLKLWGDGTRRAHLKRCLTSGSYLLRAWRGARIETLIHWHRRGRVSDERARRLVHRPVRFWLQRILVGWLPAKWHRFFTEPAYAWARLRETVRFTYHFLRNPPFREEWLLEQVRLGCEEGMLTDAEARHISDQIGDPFIQKYLKCLAVHLCTLPISEIVIVVIGGAVALYHYAHGVSGPQAVAYGTAVAALIQLAPISPGSILRGIIVIFLMIKEWDWRNYYIAAPVSFIRVVGYLAFPLQMVAHDPALARYMAGRWATGVVRFIPVFGERGALLEHAIFDLFFNAPLSIRRDIKRRPVLWAVRAGLTLILLVLLVYTVYTRLFA